MKKGDIDTYIMIKQIYDSSEKLKISRCILESLTEWFEIEESREKYIGDSADQIFIADKGADGYTGFICLGETGKDTAEIAVMGVLKEYQRQGIGRRLMEKAKEIAASAGYSFIQVKTVGMGVYDEYDRTNLFYQGCGFKEFEVFPDLWGKENPCQIYIMAL